MKKLFGIICVMLLVCAPLFGYTKAAGKYIIDNQALEQIRAEKGVDLVFKSKGKFNKNLLFVPGTIPRAFDKQALQSLKKKLIDVQTSDLIFDKIYMPNGKIVGIIPHVNDNRLDFLISKNGVMNDADFAKMKNRILDRVDARGKNLREMLYISSRSVLPILPYALESGDLVIDDDAIAAIGNQGAQYIIVTSKTNPKMTYMMRQRFPLCQDRCRLH